nr:PREDICTED: uncharacterized protein LOC109030376 [Bemisia tabaci]
MISVISFFILTLGTSGGAFKILVLYPTPSFSHQRSIMALTERLVKEGHELFVVSPNVVPNLQDWLDGAEEGVIFFSLGSNMKSKSLPEEVIGNLLLFFKGLPVGYRVLWKWELDEKIPGQPENILTQTWMPQESVLAHPKESVHYTRRTPGFQEITECQLLASRNLEIRNASSQKW